MKPILRACGPALVMLMVLAGAWAQDTGAPAESVRITYEQKAKSPELVEWSYAFDCPAGGSAPSLRVTLGQGTDSTASAGVPMTTDGQDRANGTIRLRAALADKAAGTYTVTLEIGPGGPTLIGQTLKLKPGQDLTSAVDLRQLPAVAGVRHAIIMGTVGGSMVTAFVMPGRTSVARAATPAAKTPGDPAVEAPAVFRAWVRGIKTGNLEQFGAGVPPGEWARLSPEQRTQRLQEYRESFKTVLGADFDPELFRVEYAGGAVSGKLKVRYGDKDLPELNARFYNGAWVLSEP